MEEKLTPREIYGLQNQLSKIAHTLTGKLFRVLPAKGGELGYTSESNAIYVAFDHHHYKDLNKIARIRFIRGVAFHELLHQLMTDFTLYTSTILSVVKAEQEIMGTIYNILEDSAIENFAPLYASDDLVDDLSFSRAHIYKHSPPISKSKDPFAQFIAASIQYGDAGLIKGKFTDKKARKCFMRCLPIMDRAVEEPDNMKRSEYAKQIFTISKPLWKGRAKDAEAMEKFMEELRKALKANGKEQSSSTSGSSLGSPFNPPDPDAKAPESSRSKRRKVTFRRVSAEEYKEAMKAAEESSGGDPDGDIEVLIPDEPVETDPSKGKSSVSIPMPAGTNPEEKKSEDSSKGDLSSESDKAKNESEKPGSSGSGKAEKTEDGAGDSEDSDEKSESAGSESEKADGFEGDDNTSSGPGDEGTGDDEKESGASESGSSESFNKDSTSSSRESKAHRTTAPPPASVEGDEFKDFEYTEEDASADLEREAIVSAEDAKRILEGMSAAEAEIVEAEHRESLDASAPLDYPITGGYKNVCTRQGCENVRAKVRFEDELALSDVYNALVLPMSPGIDRLSRQLSRLFKNAADEKLYRASGKVSIDRLSSGKQTARVFTKKRIASKSDIHVCVAIDISGSTGGDPITQIRNASIALAEVFSNLDIPVSMFGFTADVDGSPRGHAYHIHYITGTNTKRDRIRLLDIKARSNNFDGYSIRYGAALLKKKSAAHKLLIVISDGAPACDAYSGSVSGVADTKLAIKEASKDATVFGILVGKGDGRLHKEMYGYNFLHIKNPSDLFAGMAKALSKQIKGWE